MISPIFQTKLSDVITCGSIDEKTKTWAFGTNLGPIHFFTKDEKEPRKILCCKDSTRSIQYNQSSEKMLISDKSGDFLIYDLLTHEEIFRQQHAHNSPLECAKYLSETSVVTGDSDGHVKVWDLRETSQVMQKFHDEKEYVSDIACVDEKTFGVTTGNGVLSLYTTNRNKRRQYYAQEDDDFISLAYNFFGNMFICASSKPKLYASRCPSLDFITETTLKATSPFVTVESLKTNTCRIIAASDDGTCYISEINPNHFIYAWKAHKNHLSGMASSGGLIATWTQSKEVRIWDISEQRDQEYLSEKKRKRLKAKGKLPRVHTKRDTFFDDLGDPDSDSD